MLKIILLLFINLIAFTNSQSFYFIHDNASHLDVTHDIHQIMIEDKCAPAKECRPGLIIPVWEPHLNLNIETKIFRAFIYLIGLLYLFLGVSIVADRFMAAIEVITSQERELKVKQSNGETVVVLVRVWNETVSNLTLMALGSSAPEILLSVIELCGNEFEAGDLGPSTIVGSAAFNLFIIIAVCIVSIPDGEKRRIERNDVFWVTLLWSLFAYIWLYLILCVFSPNVVEVWEGILTFLFFFLTVISSYIANRFSPAFQRKLLRSKYIKKSYPQLHPSSQTDSTKLENGNDSNGTALLDSNADVPIDDEYKIQEFQDYRKKFIKTFQKVRHEHPDLPLREIGLLVTQKILTDAPKSRAIRRMQATRKFMASKPLFFLYNTVPNDVINSVQESDLSNNLDSSSNKIIINFQPSHYICSESVGTLKLFVKCERGKNINVPTIVYVDYSTVPGTAKEEEDFVHAEGTITFKPDSQNQVIEIKIVDNDIYEYDEEFFVRLLNPRAKSISTENYGEYVSVELGTANEALVIIVDDDHAGHFGFESQVQRVRENQGIYYLIVKRERGTRGRVTIPYTVTEGRAKRNVDFKCNDGELIFSNHQTSAEIRIEIINDDHYELSEEFFIQLGEPIWHEKNAFDDPTEENKLSSGTIKPDGRPFLNENSRCKIIIKEDDELKGFVDRLIVNANSSLLVGTSCWKQQFEEILAPFGSYSNVNEEEAENNENQPSCIQLAMHYLSFPWKFIFAFIPPTDYFQGWLCFVISIILIGILTAIIGDVAAMFGCTLGVKDSVTAITLVAMGTSLPDTFASKLSAIQDKTADASIGNVTGSNAVNVFLGIGVAWGLASIYHSYFAKDVFHVHAGSLVTSLALFLIGAIVCAIVLQYRRFSHNIGAELGGPTMSRWISSMIFISIWIIYLTYCILDAYCII